MLSKIGKRISKALTSKHGFRATNKKWLPKVAVGAMLIGSGIAVDKTLGLIEDKDKYIVDNKADDASIVDKSFSVLCLEDLTNGSKAGFTMGPARISTWVMVALLVLGATYPSLIMYRKLSKCYSKCKK